MTALQIAKTVFLTLLVLAVGAAIGAAVMVWGGLYNVAATTQHNQQVYSLLELAMRQSVRLRSRDIEVPPLDDERLLVRGAACYRDKCVQCHGAPGVSQGDIGKSMQPLPGPLVDARQRWSANELYWVTRHGIKMSGMPAWEFRLADEDLWSVVAFLQKLPDLTPAQYRSLSAPGWTSTAGSAGARSIPTPPACGPAGASAAASASASASASAAGERRQDAAVDVRRGEKAMYQYACNACHSIPGITGSNPHVGPPLAGIGRRTLIAGRLANTPENMVRWLLHTQEVDPLTAMPEMGLTERDARDIAAFLATLD